MKLTAHLFVMTMAGWGVYDLSRKIEKFTGIPHESWFPSIDMLLLFLVVICGMFAYNN